jgi:regulator of sigma E protease
MGIVTGYANYDSTKVSDMIENTPSYNAGLRDGDEILYIGDVDNLTEDMFYDEWEDISDALNKYANGENFEGFINVVYRDTEGNIKSTLVKPYVFVQSVQINFVQDGSNSLEVAEYLSSNEDTMSYKAGLKPGDVIVSCNGYEFLNRADFLRYFNTGLGAENTEFVFVVKRGGETITLDPIKTYKKQIFDDNNIEICKVQLYISPESTRNIVKLIVEPFKEIGSSCTVIFKTLGALFQKDSGLGISDLSGPVGIASATVSIVSQGALSVFNWMAILSVNIGLMNIIPLPALDGGRLAFLLYEAVTGKKTNPKVENIIHSIGLILFMLLFVFVAFNDVIKIFK